MPSENSMMFPRQFAQYAGFTEEEVSFLCSQYGREYERTKDWYDGYCVSDIIPPDPGHQEFKRTGKPQKAARYSLYSPLSVVEAMTTGVIRDYWNKTESYEALAEYIRKDYGGLKDAVALLMDGGRLAIDTSTYQNDMTTFTGRDDVFSLLIHLGYLGFDQETSEVFIPNREILDEFETSTKSDEWVSTFKSFELSVELVKATYPEGDQFALIMADLDHLKQINDTFGHNEGDVAIRQVADALRFALPKGSPIGRNGGDEFMGVIRIKDPDQLEEVLQKIRRSCEDFNETVQKPYYVNVSIGYQKFNFDDLKNLLQIIERADQELYIAKTKRRKSVVR